MGCLRLIVYGARTRVITIFMKLSMRMWLFDYLQISFLWSVNFDEELIFRVYSRFLIFLAFAQLQKALTSVLHFCYCYSIVYNLLTTCFTALNNEPRGQTFWIFFLNVKSLINESRTIRLIAKRLIRQKLKDGGPQGWGPSRIGLIWYSPFLCDGKYDLCILMLWYFESQNVY